MRYYWYIYCELIGGQLPQLTFRLVQDRNITKIFFSLGQWTEAAEDTDAAFHVLVENPAMASGW